MKFFHLSDLHIGLKLMNRDLREDQECILRQITEIAKREKPDAVVIAGDIYDKAVPSAEAVEVFDRFIGELTAAVPDAVVMMISGNHDSASRVNCFRSVLSRQNLYMVGQPPRTSEEFIEKVTCTDAYGKVNFYLLPFVKPSMVKNVIGTNEDGSNFSYEESVRRLLEREEIDCGERNVLVSHQFYLPKGVAAEDVERMDSEVRTVGNIDEISAEILKVFDYAALGHIHKPMKVGDERFRYCGTPLACSVSEAGQQKGIIMVELGPKRAAGEADWERSAEHGEKQTESAKRTPFDFETKGGTAGERREIICGQISAIDGRSEAADGNRKERCAWGEESDGCGESEHAQGAAADGNCAEADEQSTASGGQCAVSCEASGAAARRCVKVEETSAGCVEDCELSEPRGESGDAAAWERHKTGTTGSAVRETTVSEHFGRSIEETAERESTLPGGLPHEGTAGVAESEECLPVGDTDVSVAEDEQDDHADIRMTVLPLTPLRQIRVMRGTLEEVLRQPSLDYVTVILTDKTDLEVIDMQERLRAAFPYLLEIRRERERRADYGAVVEVEKDMDPFDLCCAFLKDIDEAEQAILRDVIRTVQEEADR